MRKYSKGFERDYLFYFRNRHHFKFCGTKDAKFESVFDSNGVSAKEAFYAIESRGENIPTKEPWLLDELLLCKASVNFNIKQWAQGRKDGTLPLCELSCKRAMDTTSNDYLLVWTSGGTFYRFRDMESYYGLPEWVLDAVENQKSKPN